METVQLLFNKVNIPLYLLREQLEICFTVSRVPQITFSGFINQQGGGLTGVTFWNRASFREFICTRGLAKFRRLGSMRKKRKWRVN